MAALAYDSWPLTLTATFSWATQSWMTAELGWPLTSASVACDWVSAPLSSHYACDDNICITLADSGWEASACMNGHPYLTLNSYVYHPRDWNTTGWTIEQHRRRRRDTGAVISDSVDDDTTMTVTATASNNDPDPPLPAEITTGVCMILWFNGTYTLNTDNTSYTHLYYNPDDGTLSQTILLNITGLYYHGTSSWDEVFIHYAEPLYPITSLADIITGNMSDWNIILNGASTEYGCTFTDANVATSTTMSTTTSSTTTSISSTPLVTTTIDSTAITTAATPTTSISSTVATQISTSSITTPTTVATHTSTSTTAPLPPNITVDCSPFNGNYTRISDTDSYHHIRMVGDTPSDDVTLNRTGIYYQGINNEGSVHHYSEPQSPIASLAGIITGNAINWKSTNSGGNHNYSCTFTDADVATSTTSISTTSTSSTTISNSSTPTVTTSINSSTTPSTTDSSATPASSGLDDDVYYAIAAGVAAVVLVVVKVLLVDKGRMCKTKAQGGDEGKLLL